VNSFSCLLTTFFSPVFSFFRTATTSSLIFYKGEKVGIHRLDFILEEKFVVELKAQSGITQSHIGQTKAYLKTLDLKNGIVVNFPYPDKRKPQFKLIW